MTKDDSDYEFVDDAFDDPGYTPSGKPAKHTGYQLTNVLPLPRATTYSTQALYDSRRRYRSRTRIPARHVMPPRFPLLLTGRVDVVWPESKQIGLIDSILRNFYVPPIIFVVHQHEDGSESKTCIDGKQRLTSLHRFMDGMIPHRDPLTNAKYWYKEHATQNARGHPLPERYQRLFANKQVVCIEYQDLPDTDEREIFQARVTSSYCALPNPCVSEKLQVVNTPMASFVRKLQSEYLSTGSPLGDSEGFDWDRSRGGDFRCITQALYVIAKYPSSASIGAIVQLEKWLHNPTTKPYARAQGKKKAKEDDTSEDLTDDDAYLERVHTTFRTFSNLVRDASLHPHFLRPEWRVSPIEFVMMCLLVSVKMNILTLEELAVKVGEMRTRARQEHTDIRMNSRVAKTLFDFIKERSDPAQLPEPAKTGLKRKREEEEVVLSGRKEKERKDDEGVSTLAPSPVSSVLPPPRPDRLSSLREARKAIAPPRITPPKPSQSTPASSR
ncbi:hypothetical protein OG21DRAFT_1482858 [Imleria badia]|nr:hypothetical protein OG21DRAFT_1482858 [Imleria badia]